MANEVRTEVEQVKQQKAELALAWSILKNSGTRTSGDCNNSFRNYIAMKQKLRAELNACEE
jgi:hypothetical protein